MFPKEREELNALLNEKRDSGGPLPQRLDELRTRFRDYLHSTPIDQVLSKFKENLSKILKKNADKMIQAIQIRRYSKECDTTLVIEFTSAGNTLIALQAPHSLAS